MGRIGLMVLCAIMNGANADHLDASIPLQDKGVSTYYVEVEIEGFGPLDLLVDTGSGYTAVNERVIAVLKRKGKARHVRDLEAILADGKRMKVPIYRVDAIRIGKTCTVKDVEVAVFPGNARCILGLATLKKVAPFMFSVDPPTLSVSRCQRPLSGMAFGGVR